MLFAEFVEAEKKVWHDEEKGTVSNSLVVTYADVDESGNASRKTKEFKVSQKSAPEAYDKFLRMKEGQQFCCAVKEVNGVTDVRILEVE